jgi:predicted RecA/RadA family phage recombinase
MAKNRVLAHGDHISAVATDPTTPASGDPVRVGEIPGVALTDKRADTTTSIQTNGVFNLSVKGVDGSGNHAIAVGDIVYYVDADTPKLSAKTAGHRFGYALAVVTTGATTTIAVKIGY